ncbi:MAG TPA: hypothetical protein VMZ22_01080 [Acidimicrobiales bacterium]|nr:hypothetical protein [Acidimicrobiales bacterium]
MAARVLTSLAIVFASALSGHYATDHAQPGGVSRAATPHGLSPDASEVVLGFGDALADLHDALAFEEPHRDTPRVERACAQVVTRYPELRDAVGDAGVDLLVAAESMVDACRRGFAAALDDLGFEIVDGDYYTYRELSFAFAD